MSKTSLQDLVIPYLTELYGKRDATQYGDAFVSLLEKYQGEFQKKSIRKGVPLKQHTSILITYADSLIGEPDCPTLPPLLQSFLHEYIGPVISTVHLLPFYPSSSDDGFSVIDLPRSTLPLGAGKISTHCRKSIYSWSILLPITSQERIGGSKDP